MVFAGEKDAQGIRILQVLCSKAGVDDHVRSFFINRDIEIGGKPGEKTPEICFLKIIPEIDKGQFESGLVHVRKGVIGSAICAACGANQ